MNLPQFVVSGVESFVFEDLEAEGGYCELEYRNNIDCVSSYTSRKSTSSLVDFYHKNAYTLKEVLYIFSKITIKRDKTYNGCSLCFLLTK